MIVVIEVEGQEPFDADLDEFIADNDLDPAETIADLRRDGEVTLGGGAAPFVRVTPAMETYVKNSPSDLRACGVCSSMEPTLRQIIEAAEQIGAEPERDGDHLVFWSPSGYVWRAICSGCHAMCLDLTEPEGWAETLHAISEGLEPCEETACGACEPDTVQTWWDAWGVGYGWAEEATP